MELDHVLIAVVDLPEAAQDLRSRHGLDSVEGGRHPDWGTANRIVPLGGSYLELVSVVDAAAAAGSVFGRWVTAGSGPVHATLLGWAVRTSALDEVARRLDLQPQPGSRAAPDGSRLAWRTVGVEQAAAEPLLPFFIEWEPGSAFPGNAATHHRAGNLELVRLELSGDADRLAAWLGGNRLPVAVAAGEPGVRSVVLAASGGEIVLVGGS